MTPRSSGPGGEYAPLRGTTNLRLTANQYCKCNGKLRWRSCGHHFPSQPGRGSATDCLGHSRKADLVNFSQAPKSRTRAESRAKIGNAKTLPTILSRYHQRNYLPIKTNGA